MFADKPQTADYEEHELGWYTRIKYGGMMDDCIFCKIIRGDVPSYTVYEDEKVQAFLNIYSQTEGYTLIIPKKHVEFVWDMSDEDYTAVMAVAKKIGRKIRDVYKPPRVGVQVEGLEVPHAHVKVFPFATPEEFREEKIKDSPDYEQLPAVAAKLTIKE